MIISEIINELLLEQDSKLSTLRKAITDRIPVTINYAGPPEDVTPGQRLDIEPIILGKNKKSGNLVIWAYVFKGVSRKGLPGWKMFRIDRIMSVNLNAENEKFKLESLPGYEKGKAPNAMKSLSTVDVFSPYWFEDDDTYKNREEPSTSSVVEPVEKPEEAQPDITNPRNTAPKEDLPVESPDISNPELTSAVYNELKSKVKDINGEKTVTPMDYDSALKDLYYRKEGEWKDYQRQLTGNERPGEGTRLRFTNTSRREIDDLLKKDGIKVSNNSEMISESRKRFLRLINW